MTDPAKTEKKALRAAVQKVLRTLSEPEILRQSTLVVDKLVGMNIVKEAKGCSVYVNMGCEVATAGLLAGLFKMRKRVFVPCVSGPKHFEMKMVEVTSIAEIEAWPLNKWGIRELPAEQAATRPDASSLIDVVLCPAVAFTPTCARLGHGRGYYDSFLSRLTEENAKTGCPPPKAVGLALSQQIVPSIPTSQYDITLDVVVTPAEIYEKSDSA